MLQQGAELAAHLAGERLDRQQEGAACRVPGGAVLGDAAAADQAMDVRVQVELLVPGLHTVSTPTVPPTKRGSRASSMIAPAVACISTA